MSRELVWDAQVTQGCIQCGLCLESCPTYRQTFIEGLSPRGRISLIRALAGDGAPGGASAAVGMLDGCLTCRACEAACPSGVPFGSLIYTARTRLAVQPRSRRRRLAGFVLRHLFTHASLLAFLMRILRAAVVSGTARVAVRLFFPRGHRDHFLHLVAGIRQAAGAAGPVPSCLERHRRELCGKEAPSALAPRPRPGQEVLIFRGCVTPVIFPHVAAAWQGLLARLDVHSTTPRGQTCCGALHLQQGDFASARTLARRNVAAFEAAGDGWIMVEAAGCGAALRSYGELLADDPLYAEAACRFAARVRDASEVLLDWGLGGRGSDAAAPPDTPRRLRVLLHEPCHLKHVQQAAEAPRRILDLLPGLERLPDPEVDLCCGATGLYHFLEPEMSAELARRKVELLATSGVDLVVTTSPECRLQMASRLAACGIELRHILEVCDALWPRGAPENGRNLLELGEDR